MSIRFARFWNRLGQFSQLALVVACAVLLVGGLALTALAAHVGGLQVRQAGEAVADIGKAVAAALARQGSEAPRAAREVFARYQVLEGLSALRLADEQGGVIAFFAHDGVPETGRDPLRIPEVRRATVQVLDRTWLTLTPRAQRFWLPVAWQGFSGWLIVDHDLGAIASARGRLVAGAGAAVLAVACAILFGLWWASRGQRAAVAAIHSYVEQGGSVRFPHPDRLRAPREFWRFAVMFRTAWTDLKRNRGEVEIAARRNHEMFLALKDPSFVIDEHGQILTANRAAVDVFGFSPAEFEGMHADQLVADDSIGTYREWWKEYWRTGIARRQDRPLRINGLRRSRRPFPAELSLVQIRGGENCEFAVTYRDVSETVASAARLSAALRAAEDAAQSRNAFVATIGRELRAPMSSIVAMADLALGASPTPAAREYLTTIRGFARQVGSAMDAVFDEGGTAGGATEIGMRAFDVNALLDEVRAVYEPIARHKGLRFDVALRGDVPEAVLGDVVRLRQVIDNLLTNAFKFTSIGSVRVVCESRAVESRAPTLPGAERRPVELRVSVTDTGIGIPASRLEAVFAPYTHADDSVARRFGGAGLGLATSRRLVQQMGGSIWVESREGKGSTFHASVSCLPVSPGEVRSLQLQTAAGPGPDDPRPLAERFGALRVVGLGFDAAARASIERIVAAHGLPSDFGQSVESVVDGWANDPAAVVFVGLDEARDEGLAIAARIRQAERDAGGNTPARTLILGVSTDAGTALDARCRSAGFDGCLSAEAEPGELVARLAAHLSALAAQPVAAPPPERRMPVPTPAGASPGAPAVTQIWGFASNGDPRLMRRIISLATRELPDRIDRLRRAHETNDATWIQRHAHSLVNTLVALNQRDTADLARSIESRSGEGRAALEAPIAALADRIEALMPGLEHQLAELGAADARAPEATD